MMNVSKACYFFQQGRCNKGDDCKFLHVAKSEENKQTRNKPKFQSAIPCKFFARGACYAGDDCQFAHYENKNTSSASSSQVNHQEDKDKEEDTNECGICFEQPTQFGLLSGCEHCFCFECITSWRTSGDENDRKEKQQHRTCPTCRQISFFVVNTPTFLRGKTKELFMTRYKAQLAQTPCRNYRADTNVDAISSCKFGPFCFYQHLDANGVEVPKEVEAEAWRERQRSQLQRQRQRRAGHRGRRGGRRGLYNNLL